MLFETKTSLLLSAMWTVPCHDLEQKRAYVPTSRVQVDKDSKQQIQQLPPNYTRDRKNGPRKEGKGSCWTKKNSLESQDWPVHTLAEGLCSWEGEQDRGLTLLEAPTVHSF